MSCWNQTKITELHLFEVDAISNESQFWQKSSKKNSEGSKAKSPSNVASFPPIIFLMIITILIHTI